MRYIIIIVALAIPAIAHAQQEQTWKVALLSDDTYMLQGDRVAAFPASAALDAAMECVLYGERGNCAGGGLTVKALEPKTYDQLPADVVYMAPVEWCDDDGKVRPNELSEKTRKARERARKRAARRGDR